MHSITVRFLPQITAIMILNRIKTTTFKKCDKINLDLWDNAVTIVDPSW